MIAASWSGVAGDVAVVFGVAVITLSVVGLLRMPDAYLRLHAAGKAVVFGDVAIAAASLATGDGAMVVRCALIALFVLVTTPIGTHAIAQAAWREGEALGGRHPVDESRPEGG